MDLITDLWFDYTLRTVALGSATFGLVSGSLGTYAVLRRQSLLGDAISHAALPGIALAFLLTGAKSPAVLIAGAAVAGWLATRVLTVITRNTRIKYDGALGLVLSVFFGGGLVLLTFIQRRPDARQAGLDNFLFGQAASLVVEDVIVMAVVGAAALACMMLFWKELKLLSFDSDFGEVLGFGMRGMDILLNTLFVVGIVIGLQTVGVVLMSAMLIAPAAAARQWTDRLSLMAILAATFGALAGGAGALISATQANVPTGPTIVLAAGVLVVISFFLAPNRGLVARRLREWRQGRRIEMDRVLADLAALAHQHADAAHPHEERVIGMMSMRRADVRKTLRALEERGFVEPAGAGLWSLTAAGLTRAADIEADHEPENDRYG